MFIFNLFIIFTGETRDAIHGREISRAKIQKKKIFSAISRLNLFEMSHLKISMSRSAEKLTWDYYGK